MSQTRYTPEFKDEAARQVIDRGHSASEVADRLGVASITGLRQLNLVSTSSS